MDDFKQFYESKSYPAVGIAVEIPEDELAFAKAWGIAAKSPTQGVGNLCSTFISDGEGTAQIKKNALYNSTL